jgi:hypothetical protein
MYEEEAQIEGWMYRVKTLAGVNQHSSWASKSYTVNWNERQRRPRKSALETVTCQVIGKLSETRMLNLPPSVPSPCPMVHASMFMCSLLGEADSSPQLVHHYAALRLAYIMTRPTAM